MRSSLAALVLLGAVPAAAQDSTEAASDFRAMTGEELGARLVALGRGDMRHPCSETVPLFEELHRRNPRESRYENGLLAGQAYCAYEEKRYLDGMNLVEKVERRNPGNGGFEPLGIYLATQLGDGREALSRLRAMTAAGTIVNLSPEVLGWTFRTIRENGQGTPLDRFAYELAASGTFARMEPNVQALLAAAALSHAARSGETARVDTLLKYIRSPSSMLDYLALREYEPIWPQLERRAGDNLSPLSDDFVAWTAARAADSPEDRDRLSEYSYALLYAGRYREAVDLGQNWLDTRQHEGEIAEGDAWALNIQAYAYDALGQPAEADRVFDRLAQVSPDEHPWVVNFVINRGSRLVGQERWAEGLAATDLAWSVADTHGSTYAKLLIARDRTCALHHLGRGSEAARDVAFLVEHFDENVPIGATGLLCAGMQLEVGRRLAGALTRKNPRATVMREMQDARFELFYTPSALPRLRDFVLADDALRAEVFKDARVLPDRFVPIAYLRRQDLANAARGQ
jgi:tetratricopeptide (TPR) repeat protein